MKKSKEFLKKLAVITLSCTSLLQFTSVFAEGPENSNVGKSQLSVFKPSNPRSYTVQHGTINQKSTPSKSPRPPYSQQKEHTNTPKKPAKKPPEEPTEQIGPYEFPAGTSNITDFDVFKTVRPKNCLIHHGIPDKYSGIHRRAHLIMYTNQCGCGHRTITYSDLGGILGWKLARAAVLAGYAVPPFQRCHEEWDIYANPRPNSELKKTLVNRGLWIEEMTLTELPKNLKYDGGEEFTEIDKRIFCEIRTKGVPPEWKFLLL